MRRSSSGVKGGKFFPALCNIIGSLILAGVILTFMPAAVPKIMGYEVYNVISGSMEPQIPVGSVIYVKYQSPETINENDIIAFWSMDSVISHRVLTNDRDSHCFVTKGDANATKDMNTVNYNSVIGVVKSHFPYIGGMLEMYTDTRGKLYAIVFAAFGASMNMLAGFIRRSQE